MNNVLTYFGAYVIKGEKNTVTAFINERQKYVTLSCKSILFLLENRILSRRTKNLIFAERSTKPAVYCVHVCVYVCDREKRTKFSQTFFGSFNFNWFDA